ncbi:MAG: hypothetical protein KF729_01185 [Sandaracinaceae bacterium]|nr:hypothetical protein [Sandaracinaceae bacterium]
MGGGWFGYVLAMFGCGVVVAAVAAATVFLYSWRRIRGGGREPRGIVRSLSGGEGGG